MKIYQQAVAIVYPATSLSVQTPATAKIPFGASVQLDIIFQIKQVH